MPDHEHVAECSIKHHNDVVAVLMTLDDGLDHAEVVHRLLGKLRDSAPLARDRESWK